ncbi:hypothetical protein C5167_036811 [Papaver somniferum]|uniref:Uncharacterized protein n=1 Tax=Papaver somniferum TaxID=3469 RepID=A0A4Y7I8A1_PAPSO|nr:hypothetical protein C5167_036811 [Papaver somniferum]
MIYNVPLHLWNNIGLSPIASFVGKPLLMDEYTRNKTRLIYARVLIEISIDFVFPNSIPLWVDGKFVMNLPVEYQWKPQKCALCSSFGHSSNIGSLNGANSKTRRTPWKKQTSATLEKSQSFSKETSIEKEKDGGVNIENVDVLTPPIDVQPNRQMVVDGVGAFEKMAESGDLNEELFIESKTYTRRNKESSKRYFKPKQTPICHLNPFGVSEASPEIVNAETVEALPKSREEEEDKSVDPSCEVEKNHEDVVTCQDESEESEHGTDVEELCVEKLKPLEDISRRKTMSREQHIGAPIGDKEAEAKNIFGGIIDRYQSLKADKDLGPSNEELGRGKRASAKKKL